MPIAKSKPKPKAKAKVQAKAPTRTRATASRSKARTPRSSPVRAPYGWQPRPYQSVVMERFPDQVKRALLIWHRRAGKDSFGLNNAAIQMEREVGSYWHMFPLHSQARRAIWWGMDKHGVRFIDQAFPEHLREKVYETDMLIRMTNGSTWQLLGSDYYDRLVGANTKGVTFSEWALCDPRSWDYIRPIIRENGGWAAFITTYRGRNHAYQMVRKLQGNPDWIVDIKTAAETFDEKGKRILSDADLQAELDDGMDRGLWRQEYFCDPLAASSGSIYGRSVERMDSRIGDYPHTSLRPVVASWSVAHMPANVSVVFVQPGETPRIIGSQSFTLEDIPSAIATLNRYPWKVSQHVVNSDDPATLQIFADHLLRVDSVVMPKDSVTTTLTRDLLGRALIDNQLRPFNDSGIESNNDLLIDSLNGYTLREVSADAWSTQTVAGYEAYLVSALETYAAWARGGSMDSWGRAPNYTTLNRLAI